MTCHAFALGGGGVLGAAEVGMARALLESGVRPDLVCGTSIGAINGAAIAGDPTPEGAQRLLAIWEALGGNGMLDGSVDEAGSPASSPAGLRCMATGRFVGCCASACRRRRSRISPGRSSAWRPASRV